MRRTNSITSPPVAQAPKQCHVPRSGSTVNEGVRSLWNGHTALYVRPAFFSDGTYAVTVSTIPSRALTSSMVLMVYPYRHQSADMVTHPFRHIRGPARSGLSAANRSARLA